MKKGAKLVYVKINDKLEHVSQYADLLPEARPVAFCPECGDFVIMHLGRKYVHHAAHKADSLCILTKPETVLHLNTKAYLAEQLSKGQRLLIAQECSGWDMPRVGAYGGRHVSCIHEREVVWLEGWDEVRVERFVETRKPDIVLYRAGLPVAAVEVFATHAVDEQKVADLKALGLPWIEVKASDSIYEGEDAWQVVEPLPFVRCVPGPPAWTCDKCLKAPADFIDRARTQTEKDNADLARRFKLRKEEEARLNALSLIKDSSNTLRLNPSGVAFTRIVFAYRKDGERIRIQYFVIQKESTVSLQVGEEGKVLAEAAGDLNAEVWRSFMQTYKDNRQLWEGTSAHVVNVTGWIPPNDVGMILAKWVSPYVWDERAQDWIKR